MFNFSFYFNFFFPRENNPIPVRFSFRQFQQCCCHWASLWRGCNIFGLWQPSHHDLLAETRPLLNKMEGWNHLHYKGDSCSYIPVWHYTPAFCKWAGVFWGGCSPLLLGADWSSTVPISFVSPLPTSCALPSHRPGRAGFLFLSCVTEMMLTMHTQASPLLLSHPCCVCTCLYTHDLGPDLPISFPASFLPPACCWWRSGALGMNWHGKNVVGFVK